MYYSNLEQSYRDARIIKHNMKSLLIGIKGDIESQKLSEASSTIDSYLNKLNHSEPVNYCTNISINLILNEKIEIAKKSI